MNRISLKYLILSSVSLSNPAFANEAYEVLMKKYGGATETAAPNKADSSKPKEEAPSQSKVELTPVKKESPQVKSKPSKTAKVKAQVNNNSDLTYALQVAAYKTPQEAEQFVKQLNQQKVDSYTRAIELNGVVWHRVYVGEFHSNQAALTFRKENSSVSFIKNSFSTVVAELPWPSDIAESPSNREPASTTISNPMGLKEQAQETKESAEDPPLLGNWWGVKDKLAEWGVAVELGYKGDYIQNFSGGIKTDSGYLSNVDLKFYFDLERIASLKGLKLVLYSLGDFGDDPTEFVGDSFASTNIESPNAFKLYEAYFEQTVDDRFQIAVGVRDLNAIYYATDTSGLFLNSAFGISPSLSQTGVNGPSIFPTAALSANVKYESPTDFYFQTGVFNAQAGDPEQPYRTYFNSASNEGYLSIWQAGYTGGEGATAYQMSLGAWTFTKPADRVDETGTDKNSGYYLLADKAIGENFSVFLRYGIAQQTVNEYSSSTELGVAYKGLIPQRPDDMIGFGIATAQVSKEFKDANADSRSSETVYELTYSAEVYDGVTLIPDYQYIVHPGHTEEVDKASVGGVRLQVSF